MSSRVFIPYEQKQDLLLPPSLEDWLPQGHLARFISDTLDELDLCEWEADYATETGSGAPPFHPAMMLKVLVYGYATGTFSSRKLAQRCVEDVAYRYLAGQQTPDFRSFIKFRKRHVKRFERLFVQVVHVAQEAGLVKLGRIAIDGTKLKANASKHKAMSYEHMLKAEQKLEEEIQALLTQAESQDEAEDARYGEADGYSLPERLARKQTRLEAIRAAKARLEERARERAEAEQARRDQEAQERAAQGEKPKRYKKAPDPTPKPKEQENFTDPESRIMKDGATKGFIQGYNAQVAVDEAHQIIVAADLDNRAADVGHFVPMLDKVEDVTGRAPDEGLADAGYKSEETFEALEGRATEAYIACGRETYDPRVACPQEPLPEDATATQRMERKLLTPEGRRAYRRRKWIVEAPLGWIKRILGFRQVSLRGQDGARGEWHLVCLAMNLRRMAVRV
jgi:transposase